MNSYQFQSLYPLLRENEKLSIFLSEQLSISESCSLLLPFHPQLHTHRRRNSPADSLGDQSTRRLLEHDLARLLEHHATYGVDEVMVVVVVVVLVVVAQVLVVVVAVMAVVFAVQQVSLSTSVRGACTDEQTTAKEQGES